MNLPLFDSSGISLHGVRRDAFNKLNKKIYYGELKVEVVERCFCGDNDFRKLSKYDRFGLPFGTQICRSCGLITQTLRLTPDSLPLFYAEIYWPLIEGDYNPGFVTVPSDDQWLSYILNHISFDNSHIDIIEIGCGSGTRLAALKRELEARGMEVHATGCDYSESALSIARTKGIDIVLGGLEEVTAVGVADVVILSHVFEHLPDLNSATRELSKITNCDSIIYIEVPGVIDLENKREYLYNYQLYSVLAHTYNFSLQSLAMVMESGGFALVEGDEFVRSIFKKIGEEQKKPVSNVNVYHETIRAIERAYVKQASLERKRDRPIVKYARNLAKALLGRSCN